jgi:hypothetical protein
MSDLIKREDAIEAIHNYWKKRLDTLPTADIQQTDKILEHNKTLCNFINAIPSAGRPQGEWREVTNGRGGHECSNCHEYAPSYMSGDEHLSDFCPNCGAKMKGADDE